MIFIVAPYSPIELSSKPHLGAARKIEMVIEALASLDSNLVLINSAHNEIMKEEKVEGLKIGKTKIQQYTIPTYSNPRIGKLLNLKDVGSVVDRCLSLGKPDLVWIYNGYAFENLFSISIKKKVEVPVVLEFEDWHFARGRGLNPKPYLDYILWKMNLKNIGFSFGVNDNLVNIMENLGVRSALLPGIVPNRLIELCDQVEPFELQTIKIGYFGGLSKEKGVDVLIEVMKLLPDGYVFVISGAGELEKSLQLLAEEFPNKLEFYGRVSQVKLYDLIASVDIVVNPHSPINDMASGVFPFKVIEAIASGKLLFSTQLPNANVSGLLDGVVFYDGSADSLITLIRKSKTLNKETKTKRNSSSVTARERFSLSALLTPINRLISGEKGK